MVSVQVRNPYDGAVVCDWPLDSSTSLDAKLAAAERAYGRWRRLSFDERLRYVQAGLDRFRSNAAETAREITLQMGKPLKQAEREVETFFERAGYMVSIARQTLAPEVLPPNPGFIRRIEHRSLGVILNLAAWNYPLLIP